MRKYRPKARWVDELECEVEDSHVLIVFEKDDGVPTGIFDEHGNELLRYEKGKMGFLVNA